MVEKPATKCSHCGHYGHNSRACNGEKYFKLFGVNIGKSMTSSMNMVNLQSDNVHVDAGSSSDGKSRKARKKGTAWSEKEHSDFLAGLDMLGKGNWKGISMNFVKTRTPSQVASHGQKHFLRQALPRNKNRRSSIFDGHYHQHSALPTCQDSLPVKNDAANFSSSQANNICSDPILTMVANSSIPSFYKNPHMTQGFLATSNMPTLSYVLVMPPYRYMPGNIAAWAHPSGIHYPQSVSSETFQ